MCTDAAQMLTHKTHKNKYGTRENMKVDMECTVLLSHLNNVCFYINKNP